MEQPKIEMEEELIPAEVELDEEDTLDLIYECYDLLTRLTERTNPAWLQSESLALVKKLEATLGWYRIH